MLIAVLCFEQIPMHLYDYSIIATFIPRFPMALLGDVIFSVLT